MIDVALERHGRLDILVNNAAAPQGLDRNVVDDVPVDVFDEVIRINLRGTWLMCRAAVPACAAAAGAGSSTSPRWPVRSAPRGPPRTRRPRPGCIGLTRALAMDVAAWGITVNSISPGALGTSRSVLSLDPGPRRRRRAGPPGQPSAGGPGRHAR